MEKSNQKLIIGLIAGLLLGLVIALYTLDYFPVITSFLFYLLIALFFIALVGVLAYTWFKDWILQKIFGEDFKEEKAKEDLQQLYEQVAVKYVGQLLQDVPEEQREKAEVATPRLLKLGVWAFTRSWALRLLITIFVAVGGLLGTMLLYNQNQLLTSQNELVLAQNEKFDIQNERLSLQNNLLEADRRSSLVFLMSNILDKVDEEIRAQKRGTETVSNSAGYSLSRQLVNRIIALSKAFRPYRMMEGDSLSSLVSPERGQLFITLMENGLDSMTQNEIVQRGNFNRAIIGNVIIPYAKLSKAYLSEADFRKADLHGADLSESDLSGANLSEANLRGADLSRTNLVGANLRGADLHGATLKESDVNRADFSFATLNRVDFEGVDLVGVSLNNVELTETDLVGVNLSESHLEMSDLSKSDLSDAILFRINLRNAKLEGANLSRADLSFAANLRNTDFSKANIIGASFFGANLNEIKNITIDQLKSTHILYECRGLDPDIETRLKQEKPCLFNGEGCIE